MGHHLSPEIVSLIHHVELNKSGWWKKAIGQVVQGVLWKAGTPQSIVEVQSLLKGELGIELTLELLERQFAALSSEKITTQLPDKKIKLTEKARAELTDIQRVATDEGELCKRSFLESCVIHCPTLDSEKLWAQFQSVLVEAIRVTGANLFHLLSDGNLSRESDWVNKFLSRVDESQRDGIRRVIAAFFSPNNQACRNQVLRLMTAHFFAEASQLRPETIAVIEGRRTKRTIKVVLDTNFIFSILQLHDNPGDDSAISLVDIAQRTDQHLEVKLYVLPATLDEAQRVIQHQLDSLENIRATTAMSRAALRQPLPSIAKKFFDVASRVPNLSAKSFFQPYIDDLQSILRGKNIQVLDAHPEIYNKRQDVIDDVLEERQREEKEVPEARRKGYGTHLHDVVLWHAINDRRPTAADTPFDVEYWAVSIDWRLINFDKVKRSRGITRLPIVLHPSNLVQLLQFWIPRSKVLEDSLVDSLRLPLFFQPFDPDDERATIKVLETISRFENVDDMSEETVRSLLTNQALREKLREADVSNDESLALIREQLLAEHNTAVAKLTESESNLTDATSALDETRKLHEHANSKILNLEEELQAARDAALQLATASHNSLLRTRFALGFGILPWVLGCAAAFFVERQLGTSALQLTFIQKIILVSAAALAPAALACAISPMVTRNYRTLREWWLGKCLNFLARYAVFAPLALALSAIFQGGIWEVTKGYFGFH